MLGVIYVLVNSKHYPVTIYKCAVTAEYYIYQMNDLETYVKVVNTCF